MKIKMIAVKRHTSVPCIPLTPQFVVGVYKTWHELDNAIKGITHRDDNGNLVLDKSFSDDFESQVKLSAYNTLGDIIEAFESDCEPEQN